MGRIISWLRYTFTNKDPETRQLIHFIKSFIGTLPNNIKLYQIALKKTSTKEEDICNERLEFLGDAILSLVIAEYLFKKFPLKQEGFLTDIRARIVSRLSLNDLAKKIHLDKLVALNQKSYQKFSCGNALEAFIGAIYIDHSYRQCQYFIINQLMHNYINLKELIENDTNYKSQLINWSQKNHIQLVFETISTIQDGPNREFAVQVLLDGQIMGEGTGSNKKAAEQMAAHQALGKLSCKDSL